MTRCNHPITISLLHVVSSLFSLFHSHTALTKREHSHMLSVYASVPFGCHMTMLWLPSKCARLYREKFFRFSISPFVLSIGYLCSCWKSCSCSLCCVSNSYNAIDVVWQTFSIGCRWLQYVLPFSTFFTILRFSCRIFFLLLILGICNSFPSTNYFGRANRLAIFPFYDVPFP